MLCFLSSDYASEERLSSDRSVKILQMRHILLHFYLKKRDTFITPAKTLSILLIFIFVMLRSVMY